MPIYQERILINRRARFSIRLKFLERITKIKKILVKARIDIAGRSVRDVMEFEADGVASRVVGEKFYAAAARGRKIKSSADLVRSQRAAVVGNFFVENQQTGFDGDKRLDFRAAAEIQLEIDRR